MDYKDSLFLPKTDFMMKADLPNKESDILAKWQAKNIYKRKLEKRLGAEKHIIHWGPPYANGNLHIGHALNGILKDIINRMFFMAGYDTPLVPGWDCHGLPIEWQIEEQYRKENKDKNTIPDNVFRAKCREFASKWVDVQKDEFARLGIDADYENPYRTMDFKSESMILKAIHKMVEKKLIYSGFKPVLWSVVEQTALAEAEVIYMDHTSSALDVGFKVMESRLETLKNASIVIWTTTPWTLPMNQAIAYHPDMQYLVLEYKDQDHLSHKIVVASDLFADFEKRTKLELKVIANIKGEDLEGTICQHPLYDFGYQHPIRLLSGEHVTADTGTGFVHTAPSHGLEDFAMGERYDLPIQEWVLPNGVYSQDVPAFAGLHIFKAHNEIIEKLGKNCIHHAKYQHSYPHSWRSKTPLIYRATAQWFLDLEGEVKAKALELIDNTKWIPEQGYNRISSMIEKRGSWCLSRQRLWGVPLAFFIDKNTREPLLDKEVQEKIIKAFEEKGADVWFEEDLSHFLSDEQKDNYVPVRDIVDVWFDSGVTHYYVLKQREDLEFPADMYLEGSDQHRGWFQSSLLSAAALYGKSPYKKVLTHGFVLDQEGYKMSKSLGNVVSLQDFVKNNGADILRLWVALSDYSQDLRIGNEIITRTKDVYRRLRNTFRYLLGGLKDFDYSAEKMEYENLENLEKWVLHALYKLDKKFKESINSHELNAFYHELHNFCNNELSAFYFDIRKDTLYCDASNSNRRKSTRFVFFILINMLVRYLAPVLPFTADEVYDHMKEMNLTNSEGFIKFEGEDTIHLCDFIELPSILKQEEFNRQVMIQKEVKKLVSIALEDLRTQGVIGSSLEAEVDLYLSTEWQEHELPLNWERLFIVSGVNIFNKKYNGDSKVYTSESLVGLQVLASKSLNEKCQRCWKHDKSVNNPYDNVCQRCDEVVNS